MLARPLALAAEVHRCLHEQSLQRSAALSSPSYALRSFCNSVLFKSWVLLSSSFALAPFFRILLTAFCRLVIIVLFQYGVLAWPYWFSHCTTCAGSPVLSLSV